jgi:precorrin-3B synthase
VHSPFDELDGALVRVRLPGGRLSGAGAGELAAVAARVGAGPFELTNRANLQLRGIPVDAVPGVRAALVAAGVTPADPGADARRNVLASPTAGIDAAELVDTRPLVDAVAAHLAGADVPSPKFGVLVDGGGAVHVRGRRHDLALGAASTLDGAVVYEVALGAPLPLVREPGATVRVVDPERVLDLLRAVLTGADGDVGALLADRPATDLVSVIAPPAPAVGVHPQRSRDRVWVGAVTVLGRLEPATLDALASLAPHELRVTPWRGIVLPDVPAADADHVVGVLHALDLVTDPVDPAGVVVACAGDRGCAAGLADTQADARELVARLRAVPVAERPRSVHVSGCEKGCARATPADVSFVATAPHCYDRYSGDPTVSASHSLNSSGFATPKPVETGQEHARFGELVESGCHL